MCDKRLASPYFGKNNTFAKWYFGKIILWQNDIVAKQYFGKIVSWDTHWPLSKQTHCSKQTILQICSQNSRNLNGRRTTNPKVFDLHRKNKARTSWSKRTPQEPELCATMSDFDLLIRLRQIVRCGKGGTRLGCVLSSRVPGRRDAAVHEHALKSCAAHTGLPCKDRSAKLEFEIFGSWNHVSWPFYRFMLCDKRHCLQVFWFEAGSTHCKQTNTIQVFESYVAQAHSTNAI